MNQFCTVCNSFVTCEKVLFRTESVVQHGTGFLSGTVLSILNSVAFYGLWNSVVQYITVLRGMG